MCQDWIAGATLLLQVGRGGMKGGCIRLAPDLRAECGKAEHPHLTRGALSRVCACVCVCLLPVRLVFVPPPPSLLYIRLIRCFTCTTLFFFSLVHFLFLTPPALAPSSSSLTCRNEGGKRERESHGLRIFISLHNISQWQVFAIRPDQSCPTRFVILLILCVLWAAVLFGFISVSSFFGGRRLGMTCRKIDFVSARFWIHDLHRHLVTSVF